MPSTAASVTPRSSRPRPRATRVRRAVIARLRRAPGPGACEVRTWVFHAVANGLSRVTRSAGTSGGGPTGAPGSQAERSMWTIVSEP